MQIDTPQDLVVSSDPQMIAALTRKLRVEWDATKDEGQHFHIRDAIVEPEFLTNMGIACELGNDQPEYWLTRVLTKSGWVDQTMIGLPVLGTMQYNLGPRVCVGSASRFIPYDAPVFNNDKLVELLRNWGHIGPVSIIYNKDDKIKWVQTGVPFYGWYELLTAVRGRLADWFNKPEQRLYEYWTVAILLSRFPFPVTGQPELPPVLIESLTPEIERWFWLFEHRMIRRALYSVRPTIGVAVNWSKSLREACSMALASCWAIRVEDKQFRTDFIEELRPRYKALISRLMPKISGLT
jgi:hypothetical protein